jgi:transcriptional regulator with GAF, ATPase, and Fis domain
LRERREDTPLLSYYFLKTYATKFKKTITKIPYAEMEKLIKYDWPGNVRELENVIERAVILSYGPYLHLPELVRESQFASSYKKIVSLQENERNHIRWALKHTGWKIRGRGGAAELLRIHPNTLDYRIKKLGIKRPEKSSLPYSTAYHLTE